MNEDKYSSNMIWNPDKIKGPYLLITKKYEDGDAHGPGCWEIGDIYEFKTKNELEEAMKVLDGIPVKTLEAKITKIHEVKIKE